ncbi:MAG: MBL fold metallo-hydrolase [Betaproteobacteria bacterium]|nr:MBL fold metallo-hydrolase [Betaproteobacteria bacterium]
MLRTLLLLLALAASVAARAAPPAATVPMPLHQVSAHCWVVVGQSGAASAANQGFMSNAGFVVTPAGVVVFDTLGTPPLAQRLVEAIRSVTDRPVVRVIVSHYHADHYYGLQVFKTLGAEIWAHRAGQAVLGSEAAAGRLAQRREVLAPWVDASFRALPADLWLEGDTDFTLGGMRFAVRHVGPAHAPEDLVLWLPEEGVLYAGDLVFKGRVPFVGDADSRAWLAALERLLRLAPRVLVPGHGEHSVDAAADLALTRDYLAFLRAEMGRAVAEFVPFDEAWARTDWSRWAKLPAFAEAGRRNAFNTYVLMEREALGR